MEATSLQKGGIYNHFRNKDELALEAFDYTFAKVIKRFRQRLDQDKTSAEKLHSVIAVFHSLHNDPVTEGGCPISNMAFFSGEGHPEIKQRAKESFRILENYIAIKVEEGMDRKEFKKTLDPAAVAALFVATLEGAIMLSRIGKKSYHMDVVASFLKNYIGKEMLVNA